MMPVEASGGNRSGVTKKNTEAGRANVQAAVIATIIRRAARGFEPSSLRFSRVTSSLRPLFMNTMKATARIAITTNDCRRAFRRSFPSSSFP
ncbi:MAG: hypothetical protein HW389_3829 [Bacteroidetes bacterium]|nr:hypothetical protein [Bacteroidota bacterium]